LKPKQIGENQTNFWMKMPALAIAAEILFTAKQSVAVKRLQRKARPAGKRPNEIFV